jgi:hypothetical protein
LSKDASDLFPPSYIFKDRDAFIDRFGIGPETLKGVVEKALEDLQKEVPMKCNLPLPKGYHLRDIPRGVFGQLSKIQEEILECEDAYNQGSSVMLLLELADLVGAIRGYLATKKLSFTDCGADFKFELGCTWLALTDSFRKVEEAKTFITRLSALDATLELIGRYIRRWNLEFTDLIRMADITDRAFTTGHRKRKDGGETITLPLAT